MKRTIALLVMALAMLVGVPASAANYDMSPLKGESGYRISITSAITTSDFIIAPAFGFQRIAFTKGSAFEATAYACENKGYVAAQCTSVATLSASTENTEVKTARPWLVFDVTAAETGSNVSYLTTRGHHTSAGGSGGGGGVTLVTESTLPVTGDASLIYRITNATNGSDCAAGTPGTEQADCRWNGSSYEPISQGTAGLANVADDANPALGGNLNAGGNAISGVANLGVKSLNDSEFHVAQYADLNTAIAACASAGGGRVVLPSGNVNSTLVVLPKDALNKAICSLEGVGSTSTLTSVGASVITVTDANASGEAALHVTASGQILRGFTVYVPNAVAGTRGILFQSNAVTEAGGGSCVGVDECDPGEYGINNFVVEDVVSLGPAAGGPGIGMEFQFSLKGRFDGGESLFWDQGVLYNAVDNLTATYLPNAANVWTGTKIRANDEGFVLAGYSSACSSVTFNALTIEGNHDGLVAKSGSDCFVNDFGSYYEQSLGTQATRTNILWEAVGGNYYSVGPWFSSSGVDANRDIVRTTDFDTYGADVVIGGRFGNGVDYAAAADIQLINSRYIDSIDSGVTYGTGLAHATDCPTYGARSSVHPAGTVCYELDDNKLYVCDPDADGVCEDAVEWVAYADITQVAGYASGQAFVEGVASTGSVVLTMEGTTLDANEFVVALQDDDPSADITWYQPDASSLIVFPTGTRSLATHDGTENLSNKTLISPLVSGSMDMNIGVINDNDCTGDQGEWWYDTTELRFEWCPANSGTPALLGGGSSIFDTSGAYAVTAEDMIIGGNADNTPEAGEVEIIDGDVVADSFTARPDADAGGSMVLSEGTNDGAQTFSIKVPDGGIGGSNVQCELDSAGKIPVSCLVAAAPEVIASGTVALDTDAIASTACDTSDTGITATGVASTDVISWTPNGDISAVTGYAPATTGGLIIYPYPGTNTVSFKVCNPTSSSITPGSVVTLNYQVLR